MASQPNEQLQQLLYLAALSAQVLEPVYSLEKFIDLVVVAMEGDVEDSYPGLAYQRAKETIQSSV